MEDLYNVQNKKTSYGINLILSGEITVDEIRQLKIDLEELIQQLEPPFGSIVDTREMLPVQANKKLLFYELGPITKNAGIQRRAIIFQSPIIKNQATQLSHISGTDTIERRINAFEIENWEQIALDWVVDGIEPTSNKNIIKSIKEMI